MKLWSQLCLPSLGREADEAVSREQLVFQSRMLLAPTEQPAAWQDETADMLQWLLLHMFLGSEPDTGLLVLVFAVSTVEPTADLLLSTITQIYNSIESIRMVARELVTGGERQECKGHRVVRDRSGFGRNTLQDVSRILFLAREVFLF